MLGSHLPASLFLPSNTERMWVKFRSLWAPGSSVPKFDEHEDIRKNSLNFYSLAVAKVKSADEMALEYQGQN